MFQVAKFDSNNDADSMCSELFLKKPQKSFKKDKKIKQGKITKKTVKEKLPDTDKLKDEIRNILKNNIDSIRSTKINIKNKKKSPEKLINDEQKSSENIKETKLDETSKKKKKHKKKKKQKIDEIPLISTPEKHAENETPKQKKKEKLKQKLLQTLIPTPSLSSKKQKLKNLTLRERMMLKLQAARFRFINEQIYSSDSKEAQKIFKEDPEAFTAYHEGYRQQVDKWPLNPVDVIIESIKKLPKNLVVADFGCGDAKLATSVEQKVHSFDLVAVNDLVTACDMARVPLQNSSVDVVVFCLSLMGTNLHDYLLEANRVLKVGGILKISEVESRFDDVSQFIQGLNRFHFKNTWKDLSHNLFYFLDFRKEANVKNKKKLPSISLHPCLYKKR